VSGRAVARGGAVAAAVAVLCAGCGGKSAPPAPTFAGTALPAGTVAPNFILHDQNGRTISLVSQRGHDTVVTFLYTRCPDVCPIIAGTLNQAIRSPAGRRAGLTVLAVSVDPARDTPAAARRYVHERGLSPAFHYLVGTRAQLAPVWAAYHVQAVSGPKGTITHGTWEIVVDPQGHERVIEGAPFKASDVVHDVTALENG
jgi:protein SCO1